MMMAGKQRNNDLHLHECKGSRPQSRPHSSSCTGDSTKRFKATSGSADYQMESLSTRERKDRIGERVVALQQLVSPFGKTDTASVLQEATDYIRFLHEQVQVLSSPYLQSPNSQCERGLKICPWDIKPPTTFAKGIGSNFRVEGSCGNLRNRGLCLVPLSHTNSLASDNGADIWAPQKH